MNAEAYKARVVTRAASHRRVLVFVAYALIGIVIAVLLRDIRFDDPYITYRYAENLATGRGFVFNPGESTLITTAPLYALILALVRVAGADIPMASMYIGAASLIVAAFALYLLGWLHDHEFAGFSAGLFLLLFPLAWLTLGFETPLFLAVALLTFLAVDARRPLLAGIGAGLAIGLRGDGLIVLAVALLFSLGSQRHRLNLQSLISNLRRPILISLVAVAVYAPLAVWLTLQFGSPLPTTLQTKSAQAMSGLTGFYPFTSFLEGGVLLVRALLAQSIGLIALLVAVVGGVVYATKARARLSGLLMPVLWALTHLIGYSILGVAPYAWYYAPIVPGIACLAGLGVAWPMVITPDRSRLGRVLGYLTMSVVALCLLVADTPIVAVSRGATPPPPTDLRAKLLPETKVDIYAQVGQWVRDHTPPGATLGVTELGVISYDAQRHTVDFLGLTQPQYLDAIRHGDYMQTLLREQPDYVALSGINAVYDFDPQRAAWFTALYTQVVSFTDERFWGSPMSIWRRMRAPITMAVILDHGVHELGSGWQVTAIMASSRAVNPKQPLFLRLQLQAGQPVGNRTLRVQPVVIQGGDGLLVSSRLIFTNQWRVGEQAWVDVPITPQPEPPKGGYVVESSWLEGGPTVRAGTLKVKLDAAALPGVPLALLSNGVSVEVFAQPITACIADTTPITLSWRGGTMDGKDYTAFVQVRKESDIVAQADAPPRNGTYPTSVWSPGEVVPDPHMLALNADVAAGEYALVVGLYNPADNTRWPVDPSPYRTPDGGVNVGRVIVKQCR